MPQKRRATPWPWGSTATLDKSGNTLRHRSCTMRAEGAGPSEGWPSRDGVVAHEEELSALLSDFARTVITDFPIQGILDHLVERIVEVLPIMAAGVTLITPGGAAHYVAASNKSALNFERLQTELSEGPCEMAFETGEAVSISDLATERRFERFKPKALDAGLVAVFAFPLNHGDTRLGALDLYCDTVGPLEDRDMRVAQTLADVAAAGGHVQPFGRRHRPQAPRHRLPPPISFRRSRSHDHGQRRRRLCRTRGGDLQ